LRADAVVESAGEDRGESGDEVRREAEDDDLELLEAETLRREDRPEGEDPGESVAVHRRGEQEPERRPALPEEPSEVLREHRIRGEEADSLRLAVRRRFGDVPDHRDGECDGPDRADDRDDLIAQRL